MWHFCRHTPDEKSQLRAAAWQTCRLRNPTPAVHTMQRRPLILAAASALLLAPQLPAHAQVVELAGVKFPPTVQVDGATLGLNGGGIRYRFVVKVYAAGLYLGTKATTPEAVLAAAGPRRLHVVMLRDIDANELGRLFTRGMQDNAPREEFSKSIPGTIRMSDIFSAKKRLVAGENFSVDWVPGSGTTVLVNGKAQGEPIKEPEFFNALLRIWLGPNPADAQLKDALLGQAPKPAANTGQQ
jgi:Chalcone isomerase-like